MSAIYLDVFLAFDILSKMNPHILLSKKQIWIFLIIFCV